MYLRVYFLGAWWRRLFDWEIPYAFPVFVSGCAVPPIVTSNQIVDETNSTASVMPVCSIGCNFPTCIHLQICPDSFSSLLYILFTLRNQINSSVIANAKYYKNVRRFTYSMACFVIVRVIFTWILTTMILWCGYIDITTSPIFESDLSDALSSISNFPGIRRGMLYSGHVTIVHDNVQSISSNIN